MLALRTMEIIPAKLSRTRDVSKTQHLTSTQSVSIVKAFHKLCVSKIKYFFLLSESVTYLNLKIIDGEYRIIRPAGFKSVQWVIQVSGYPIANFRW